MTGTAIVSTNTTLALNINGASLALSWPAAGIFSLYSTRNLAPAVAWTAATNAPALTNGVWLVPVSPSGSGQRFYRLQAP